MDLSIKKYNDVFLKIDCEGAEYDILLNADPEVMKRISEVVLEMHTDMHPQYKGAEILNQRMTELGYYVDMSKQLMGYNVGPNGEISGVTYLPSVIQRWIRK